MNKKKDYLILVTNDDGVYARGLAALIKMVQPYGTLYVIAPNSTKSGKSNSLTVEEPIRLHKIKDEKNLKIFSCKGTPADCVKLALNHVLPRKPDFVVSGINHGSNASISVVYSGTVGGAMEGCINGIPSMAFSITTHSPDADFSESIRFGRKIFENVIERGLPKKVCLNINFPKGKIKGVIPCRQAAGFWQEEFEHRVDPQGRQYFWLTGYFTNSEPKSKDTDVAALNDGYASIVPTLIDLTATKTIELLKKWDYEV